MNQEQKLYSLALDMVRPLTQHPFEVVEGDTGNVLCITLTNDGAAVDLDEAYVCVVFRSPAGTFMQDDTNGLTLGAQAGVFSVALLPAAYGPGNVSADVQVYSGTNRATLITSMRFTFRCRNALLNERVMAAQANYPPLITATKAANDAAAFALAAAARNGDMVQSVYDTDGDGKVDAAVSADDADKLGGNLPAHFATAAGLSVEQTARAAVQAMTEAHASRHGAGGADVITPSAIGAASLNGGKVTADQASSATNEQTASYTLTLADAGKLVLMNVADANTLTIPLNSTVAFPVGTEIEIVQYGTGVTTIAAAEGVMILSMDSAVALAGQYACATIKQLSADTWLLAGALA